MRGAPLQPHYASQKSDKEEGWRGSSRKGSGKGSSSDNGINRNSREDHKRTGRITIAQDVVTVNATTVTIRIPAAAGLLYGDSIGPAVW
jgi:hypothetical protein